MAESAYAKLSPAVVTISNRLTVADGGIDAEVDVAPDALIPTDCFFASGLTGFQLKSGTSFKPWTENSIRGELINSNGKLFPEVARLTQRRGRYVVVCTGHDLTPQQRNDACDRIVDVLASVGAPDYRRLVDVLGASQLRSAIRVLQPWLRLKPSTRHGFSKNGIAMRTWPIHSGHRRNKLISSRRFRRASKETLSTFVCSENQVWERPVWPLRP
jgi:hypothetical protein